ncbi:SET domain-containing protein [Ceratobasidium sp. AG-I]|nr:SET domain-containing protein [Ceratobasidium sp. AG-I]
MTGQQAKKRNRGTKRKAKPSQPDTSKAKRSVSPNDDETEDPQFWQSSDSEPEDYGDLNGQEQWKIDGVVDSHRGENDRMSYKIRWNRKDWHRKDGTSEECRNEHQKFIKAYQAREFRRFTTSSVAAVSNEEHKPFTTGPPGVSKNLWHQAGLLNTLAMYQELREGTADDAGIQKFTILDRDFLRGEFGSDADCDSEPEDAPPRRGRPKTESPQSPSLGGSPRPSSRLPTPEENSPLRVLQTTWNEAAARVGAASITLKNTIDNTIPHLKHNFLYSEMDLKWTSDVEGHPFSDDVYVSCTGCSDQCNRPNACGCQAPLFATNKAGPRALHKFAYDAQGRFKLSHQDVAIECNKRCRCLESCQNRVAQKPRNVPIEIFKTKTRGWGVLPRRAVVTGEVLGTFTGRVISVERTFLTDFLSISERSCRFYVRAA